MSMLSLDICRVYQLYDFYYSNSITICSYRGLYMSDLTFLDNGNPTFHHDGLVNFSKCRLIYHQIRDLVLRQVCHHLCTNYQVMAR